MAKKSEKPLQSLKIPKVIVIAARFLSLISTKWTVAFASRLFTTPMKHNLPKRELEMDAKTRQEIIAIPSIGKKIVAYHYGESDRKILLAHGWSGRGTQLVKFADALIEAGYSTVSFDAPSHGKSSGTTTLLPEFVATILELEKQFGPFEAAIGHSLGGMSLLNALRLGLHIDSLTIIGSGDVIKDILDDFIRQIELKPEFSDLLRIHFEKKHKVSMDSFSSWHSAKLIDIPVLVIHDENDIEVPVKCAVHIKENLRNGKLVITQNLGHRKILGDRKVVEKTINFIKNQEL